MKELYISPELELLCLTAQEQLANDDVNLDFDSLLADGKSSNSVEPSKSDIDVPLIGLPL